MNKVHCEICGKIIPAARLKVLPDTTTCVKCSQTEPYSREDVLGLDVTDESERASLNIEDYDDLGSGQSYDSDD